MLDGDPANLFAVFPTYQRGAMTIEGYREILGDDDVFFDFARALEDAVRLRERLDRRSSSTWRRSSPGFTGPELDAARRCTSSEWLYGTEKPTVMPDDFSAP